MTDFTSQIIESIKAYAESLEAAAAAAGAQASS